MKKLFSKIRDKKFLLWVLIIVMGVGNTAFYSFNYYKQIGLEFNPINSISIDWNIVFNMVVTVSIVYLLVKDNKQTKKMDDIYKLVEEAENNIMTKSMEVENFVMTLLKKIKE